ncbi:ALG10 [Candida theae]|uniref:Dol-P-Glc:Glc(2)Man(9)GlcNAc(2)-PP-Dol alpha-1,2-glucosyltransferase n=1 Tax=Candida theae TaxID=1198502 RepID=A0AAD5B9N8_9ASCO|nr:ALG10 [Candida theae]KAI5948695.1 ALG10 [Candida theae]
MPLFVPTRSTYIESVAKYVCVLLFLILCVKVFLKTRELVTQPFIDEIFHLRQCQTYCAYKFDQWDNKITTPPGLYILGFVYSKLIEVITGLPKLCQDFNVLRSLNLVGGVVILPIVLSNFKKSNSRQYWTVNVLSQPLLFTYYFLFYTDVWSTILVVMSLSLINTRAHQWPILSSVTGFASLWLRQTNIVWVAFIAVVYIDRKVYRTQSISSRIHSFITTSFSNWLSLTGYAINFVLFVVFLKYNGGITFGDKENHQIQLHFVQVFYCFTFINFFTWPVWLSRSTMSRYIKFITGNYGLNLLFNAVAFAGIKYIIDNYTIVHPFLLADNRHYTFYIFKRLLSQKYSSLVAVPAYHFAMYNIVTSLARSRKLNLSPIGITAFIGATVLTIVPSPLFEPRYYLIPLVIFRVYIAPSYEAFHVVEFIWLNLINLVTSYIFFTYQFTWLSEPNSIQRIIW